MKVLFKFTVFLLLALWLPATNHCDFEAADIAGLGAGDHCPLACGDTCESDVCALVEGEAYSRSVALRHDVAPPDTTHLFEFCFLDLFGVRPRPEPEPPAFVGDHFELQAKLRTWSFERRASAPACAPNGAA